MPLDGSVFGEHALPLATNLARKAGATLHLVHVHQPVPSATLSGVHIRDPIDRHLCRDERAYLADVTRRLKQFTFAPLHTALLDGDCVPTLREYAEENDIGLVVMSTHGRGALGRLWLGGIADDVVRKMPRPVLLVRPPEGECDFRRFPELRSILLPLDGTPLAEQVIEPTLGLGQFFDATYTLVRVDNPMTQQAQKDSKTYLEEVAAQLATRGVSVNTQLVIDEEPAAAILAEARARQASLIAMETHGRGGLSRLLLGSVAEKVVRGSVVPVLLNRPGLAGWTAGTAAKAQPAFQLCKSRM